MTFERLCQALRDAALERALFCLEEETEAEAEAEKGSARPSRADGRVRRDAAVDDCAASVDAWMRAGGGGAGGDAGDGHGYGRGMAGGGERGGGWGEGRNSDDGRVGLQEGVAPMLLVPLIGVSTAVAVAVLVGWVRR
jgi:hypothetical protein